MAGMRKALAAWSEQRKEWGGVNPTSTLSSLRYSMWWPLPVRSLGDHTVSMWATIRLNPGLRQRDTRGPGLKTPGHLSLKCDWLGSNERKPPLQRELWLFGLLQCWLNIQQSDTSWLLLFFFFKPWAKQYGRSRKASGWRWRRKS